jgi:hypothetical protein
MTPSIALVHIETPQQRPIRLWLPLFLLWIPLLLLAPFILLLILVVCIVGQINPWHAISTFWAILCSLPGTEVNVRADGNHVRVKIL